MKGIYTITENGIVLSQTHNLITNTGRAAMLDFLCNGRPAGVTHFVLGTGTTPPAVTDTTLVDERFRAEVVECDDGAGSLSITTFVTSSDSAFYIREVGTILDGTILVGTGVMLSRSLVDLDNSAGTRNLTIRYNLELN